MQAHIHNKLMDRLLFSVIERMWQNMYNDQFALALQARNAFQDVIGKEFIDRGIHQRHKVPKHPLFFWWQAFDADVVNWVVGHQGFSRPSVRLIKLCWDLLVLRELPNIGRIITDIRDENKFLSTVFEVHIASQYMQRGYRVEILPESTQTSCDFKIDVSGSEVYIECKSLADLVNEEMHLWENLLDALERLLVKYGRRWQILIDANSRLTGKVLNRLRKQVETDLSCGTPLDRVFDGFRLTYLQVEIAVGTEWMHELVYASPYIEDDVTQRVINNLKEARTQFPKTCPGILHVQLPLEHGPLVVEWVDKAYAQLYRKLNNNTRRINLISLSGIHLSPILQKTEPWSYYLIPHLSPYSRLPEGLRVPGTESLVAIQDNYLEDEGGAVEVEFVVPPIQAHALEILPLSRVDGTLHIKVWRHWTGALRFDIFTKAIGRHCLVVENFLLVPGLHTMKCRWSLDEGVISLTIDEVVIGTKSILQ